MYSKSNNHLQAINSQLRRNAYGRHRHLRKIVGWLITLRSLIRVIILITNNYCQLLIIIVIFEYPKLKEIIVYDLVYIILE